MTSTPLTGRGIICCVNVILGGGRGYSALRQENMEYPSTERGGGREGGEGIDGYTIPSW